MAAPSCRTLASWLGRGFLIVSVLAALAPMRRYVSLLSRDERVLWVAGVLWVLSLPVVFLAALRFAQNRLSRRSRGAGVSEEGS